MCALLPLLSLLLSCLSSPLLPPPPPSSLRLAAVDKEDAEAEAEAEVEKFSEVVVEVEAEAEEKVEEVIEGESRGCTALSGPSDTSRRTRTVFFCPRRWDLLIACRSACVLCAFSYTIRVKEIPLECYRC